MPPATPPTLGDEVVIGLGANLGDPRGQLLEAARHLEEQLGLLRVSSLYSSEAIGPAQADFLNAAVLVSWPRPLEELLVITRDIERRLGRRRGERWGPRRIDLDILWGESQSASLPDLTVPHIELVHRAFALLPLLELRPDATVPGAGISYRSFLPDVRSQRISTVRGPDWWRGA